MPQDWLARLPGEVLVATHAALLPAPAEPLDYEALSAQHFDGNVLIGAEVAGGAGIAVTDLQIRDGFGRLLLEDVLGHADVKTTMRYAHLEQQAVLARARDVIDRVNAAVAGE